MTALRRNTAAQPVTARRGPAVSDRCRLARRIAIWLANNTGAAISEYTEALQQSIADVVIEPHDDWSLTPILGRVCR
jgi:hypothetical protein